MPPVPFKRRARRIDVDTFDGDEAWVSAIAKALAHPARIRILERLDPHTPVSATEIVEGCELAGSTVSEHLRIMREATLIQSTRSGRHILYTLDAPHIRRFVDLVGRLADRRLQPLS